MKNICFLSGDITRSGGTEKVACQIMNGLIEKFNISVISLTESNQDVFYPLAQEIKHIALFKQNPDGIKQYISIVYRIRQYLQQNNVDILVDVDTILDMFSIPATRFIKTKVISWEHFNFYESMENKLRVPIRKYLTRFSDCVVTLTMEDQENFRNYFGRKHRVEQIYNPIELETANHQYSETSKTIISVGRLAKQKGFDYLIDVAELVFLRYPDWQWIILGEGEERLLLESKIKEKKLKQVKLLGRVCNVEDYLRSTAMFVLTSRYEGFPLVLIEAKANLLPIVSFQCKTGPREMIRNGVNGFLVECFNVEKMADKICELIESKETRRNFSKMALIDTEKMDYLKVIFKWERLIDELTTE